MLGLLNPVSVELIQSSQVYRQAALALAPWIVLSPWPILWQFRPQSGGYDERGLLMLAVLIVGLPFLFVLYCGLFGTLAYVFTRRRSLAIMGVLLLCGASVAYGLPGVLDLHVRPTQRLNELLTRLQESSGAKPFPAGTIISRGRGVNSLWNTTPWSKRPYYPVNYLGYTVILVLSDAPATGRECVLDRERRIVAGGAFAPAAILATFCAYYHPEAPRP
jgi:hypothetical protein